MPEHPGKADRELLLAAQAGSADAFALLVRRHQQALRGFLRQLCGNAAEADDLAQDTLLIAWQKLARADAGRSLRPWLFGIGYRRFLMRHRSGRRQQARERRHAEQQAIQQADPVAACGTAGVELDLERALLALPDAQRAAVVLCLGAGFTHEEAAASLSAPLGSVKSWIQRGREQLAAALGEAS